MIRTALLAAALLMPGHAAPAETPLDAAGFEARVTGKTMFYSSAGVPYGIEQYLPGRRVRWSFLGDECKDGIWYESDGLICFEYEDGTGPQCWQFFAETDGLRARFAGDAPGDDLYQTHETDEPMQCLGPRIGV
ncbi:hypothetical protein OCGS_1219 [Oceaniovalibus guishaninsula JLT2003]|uniref:Uncharacterized protein n=1 Tax=Oceaniovalibus guishaninsula JLT2003 TaxID=1231392 RepID=K2GNX0_9RHOB|nr:hypothetical protein [Oceaniovalibus guishaninsula]EKE44381.1 hypothetical protein OCGS_1219 [Oceaniovalibus guishaninsula JLT2003]